jgi:thiol-disulfide isomerase/thioredoxin
MELGHGASRPVALGRTHLQKGGAMTRSIVVMALVITLVGTTIDTAGAEDATGLPWPACATALHSDGAAPDGATPSDASKESAPEWQTIELTEARTAETFTIADLAGCTVVVEAMATWCFSCFEQMERVQEATDRVDSEEIVVLAVSVETNLNPDRLVDYAEQVGFGFVFTVAPVELLIALEDAFGRSVLVPPATPHIYVAQDGTFTELILGGSSVDTIAADLDALIEKGSV